MASRKSKRHRTRVKPDVSIDDDKLSALEEEAKGGTGWIWDVFRTKSMTERDSEQWQEESECCACF